MVGQGVMRECLLDPGVTQLITVGRSATGTQHPRLREIVHGDFTDFSMLHLEADACFWCLGVTSLGMKEPEYARITHDFTIAAATALAGPSVTFVFVSGTGADGDAMWARVKRRTEEDLAQLPFKDLYIFRPGLIVPLHGIRSRTRIYNVLYPIIYPLMLLLKVFRPDAMTDTERVGKAMLNVARKGFHRQILESPDINEAAAA
jgi:uncharacterized protein YbjT (DUF2867 family)